MYEKKKSDLITQIDGINELGDFSEYFELGEKYNNDDVKKMITEKVKGLIKTEVGKTLRHGTLNEMQSCTNKITILDLLDCLRNNQKNKYFKNLDDDNLKDKLKKFKEESIKEDEKIKEEEKKKRTDEILADLNENYTKVEDLDSLSKDTDIYVYQEINKYNDTSNGYRKCKVITLDEIKKVGKYDKYEKNDKIYLIGYDDPFYIYATGQGLYGYLSDLCKIDIYTKKTDVEAEENARVTAGKRRKSRRNRKTKKGKKSRKARKSRRKSNRRR